MEFSYELLWTICNGFLLSFLVSGLVSLILYCSNSTHDNVGEPKMVKSSIDGGEKKKRVKFLDQVDVEGFVKDIEADEVNRFVFVEESGEKDEISRGGSSDGGVELVDLSKKGGILVGLDGGVVRECGGIDMCLGGDVVGDQRERNSISSSVELASGENDVDKIVGCDVDVSLCSDELVNDHREQNWTKLSHVYEGEVHDVDGVDKIVGCDGFKKDRMVLDADVSLDGDKRDNEDSKIADDQREEQAKARSNVGSKERSSGVFDGEGMLNDEEWEGVERSDLSKEFARAKGFVENDDKERRLVMAGGNDLIMELYGLEKVAMEGPCHEPQPMAFLFAARAKWNAWQKLGSMSPEEAMEKYISVLSQNVPEWMEGHSSMSKSHTVEGMVDSLEDAQISTSFDQQSVNLRTPKASDLADVTTSVDQVNSG